MLPTHTHQGCLWKTGESLCLIMWHDITYITGICHVAHSKVLLLKRSLYLVGLIIYLFWLTKDSLVFLQAIKWKADLGIVITCANIRLSISCATSYLQVEARVFRYTGYWIIQASGIILFRLNFCKLIVICIHIIMYIYIHIKWSTVPIVYRHSLLTVSRHSNNFELVWYHDTHIKWSTVPIVYWLYPGIEILLNLYGITKQLLKDTSPI